MTGLSLGFDFGTGGARACAVGPDGVAEAFAAVAFAPSAARAAQIWAEALAELVAQLPRRVRARIRAVAVAATSGTVLACDGRLVPVAAPLCYDDGRARSEAKAVRRAAGRDCIAATPSSGLAKMLWFERRLGRRALCYLHQADWLAAQLTGEGGRTDLHNALKSGCDPERGGWPPWIAQLVPPGRLPVPLVPGTVIGTVQARQARRLGLAARCLVRAGTTDAVAAFLATGLRAPGEAASSLGSTLVLKLVSRKRIEEGTSGVYSHWFGRLWLVGGASNAGGRTLARFFTPAQIEALCVRIDPERESGFDYYPLPAPGERFPVCDPSLRPRLSPRPRDPALFLHAMLEGLARIEAAGYARLAALGAPRPKRVTTTGAGARNAVWLRMRARTLGVPVVAARRDEAAYGAALLAAHGSALFPGAPRLSARRETLRARR